ncbi:dihydrofolate reductase [Aquimarina sp. MAR_2010_214]|uniref:dihydrofolate reductase family protein n=1 Tax=Aquimarina sp. MAR_2010_214 TaxID=1250026 RepID=UPI000C6FFA95|nr:dihydrofolate reductase family protein [Aquimarina sp. MAR_2010_214]PKV50286.1 dihydrofolate reductase [Aquimarina sp. MAR_2010_214]
MKKIIYYVASSLDGFIAGKNDDISKFILQGRGVEKYQSDLTKFDTVIMGRKTYEFGYQYGLKPGQPAYPNMEHHIFSNSLKIDNLSKVVKIEKIDTDRVNEIRQNAKTDIYLCGGGQFAGWLLENGLIDQLKLKLNPVVLGSGTKLFGTSSTNESWVLTDKESFSDGLQILTYDKKR